MKFEKLKLEKHCCFSDEIFSDLPILCTDLINVYIVVFDVVQRN